MSSPTGSAPGTKTNPSTSGACRRARPTEIGSVPPASSSASPCASISTSILLPTSARFLRHEIACCASMIAARRSSATAAGTAGRSSVAARVPGSGE
jgi:hypothetical protein